MTNTAKKQRLDDSSAAESKSDIPNQHASSDEDELPHKSVQSEAIQSKDMYLDTVNRYMLDFDFEKVCSVSLSNLNVYACLVCGKYFQGRGKLSHAYTHSLHDDHHVFVNLSSLKTYILPEGYEVKDSSLDDIKYVINPVFKKDKVTKIDYNTAFSLDLNDKKYLPGFIGLNNIKCNDYINVIIQMLVHIPPLRDYFLLSSMNPEENQIHNIAARSPLVQQFALLTRKIWNPRAFKGQVSPHELLQEISNASNKRFRLSQQDEPINFLSWFLNALHKDLGGTKKPGSSLIHQIFQGEVRVETQEVVLRVNQERQQKFDDTRDSKTAKTAFLFLTLELPSAPLFQDEFEKNIIPQVPLTTLLNKYDGLTTQESAGTIRGYRITRLPRYLIFSIKRFTKNNFQEEKNPTIVNFPVTNLDMGEYLEPSAQDLDQPRVSHYYDLLANICHDGKAGAGNGTYKVHLHHKGLNQWFSVEDLRVEEILPQIMFLQESVMQVWERKEI
ncbi:hypothetical protein BKA69DRAFT_1109784 [Paraphysoderma sedebokerense]|nr:hypothetical protein BKA69DRAFT_1109784 [Paraphysoderma sedebokerense]